MHNFKKMLLLSVIVALFSQIYINFSVSDFKISIAIILFPIFLYIFRDLDKIKMTLLTAVLVFIFRSISSAISFGISYEILTINFPEIFFYTFYGIFFTVLSKNNLIFNLNELFMILVISDFIANIIEMVVRVKYTSMTFEFNILIILLLVAIVRSAMVWIVLNSLKFYRMLIIKEKHEERYQKLLWLISLLKTEMYWMRRNMKDIEKVMSNAYELFEKISIQEEKETWSQLSLAIAKDVHEIKKEYGLVFRGIEEILENKLQEQQMRFKEIVIILKESMINELNYRRQQVDLNFEVGNDFYTIKHYSLMSIFRNIIMNGMDAISLSKGEAKINFIHKENKSEHIFRISDTGCGIKTEDLSYIFSPGFSTKIDYSTGNINRGLGLSLVKEIVEDYLKGRIEVHSIEGKGSMFEISIPKEILEVVER